MKEWEEEEEEKSGADVGARGGKKISSAIHLIYYQKFT